MVVHYIQHWVINGVNGFINRLSGLRHTMGWYQTQHVMPHSTLIWDLFQQFHRLTVGGPPVLYLLPPHPTLEVLHHYSFSFEQGGGDSGPLSTLLAEPRGPDIIKTISNEAPQPQPQPQYATTRATVSHLCTHHIIYL